MPNLTELSHRVTKYKTAEGLKATASNPAPAPEVSLSPKKKVAKKKLTETGS